MYLIDCAIINVKTYLVRENFIILLVIMYGSNRSGIILSQIFEKTSNRLIGLYEPGGSGSLFGLRNITL